MENDKIKVLKVSVDNVGVLYMDKATHDFIDLIFKQVKELKKENKRLNKQIDNINQNIMKFLVSFSIKYNYEIHINEWNDFFNRIYLT